MASNPRRSRGTFKLDLSETQEVTASGGRESAGNLRRERSRSQPRYVPVPTQQPSNPDQQPLTQRLQHHGTESKSSRDQAQPRPGSIQSESHPFNKLTESMAAFCRFGADQFASCATFCTQHPDLWDEEERDILPTIASELLQMSEEDDAVQVISRYWMLKGATKYADTRKHRAEWIRRLGSLPEQSDQRKGFTDACRSLLKGLVEVPLQATTQPLDQESSLRESKTRSAASGPLTAATHRHHSAGTSTLPRRTSVASRHSALSIGSRQDEASVHSQKMRNMIGPQSHGTNSEPSDIDTLSVLGGQAFGGESGPKDALMTQLSQSVREKLNKDFKIYEGKKEIDKVFGVGSMISVFWHEAQGSSRLSSLPEKFSQVPTQPNIQKLGKGFLSLGPKDVWIYSHVRRFVIVIQRAGHSIGIPITSYSSKGLGDKKLSLGEQRAHAVVYARGKAPVELENEPKFAKHPICVDIRAPDETLSQASRLYYAKPQSIDHNIKVKYIGQVVPKEIPLVVGSFQAELLGVDQ